MTNLNRRNFLGFTSAFIGSAVAAPAFATPSTTEKWDLTTDIVIVGAGGAGLAAAAQAGLLGVKCIVLEKEPVVGGSLRHLWWQVGSERIGTSNQAGRQRQRRTFRQGHDGLRHAEKRP